MSSPVDFSAMGVPRDPCTLTIFGATGDLTHRKLMPALFSLFRQGLLPDRFAVVGFARRDYDDLSFRAWMADSIRRFSPAPVDEARLADFLAHVHYQRGDVEADPGCFHDYRKRLDDTTRFPAAQLFYLSVKPDLFGRIVEGLDRAGLIRPVDDPAWSRVVVEKPFGMDLLSARALNRVCLAHLDERQIFRIDHYLGKETVQNILSVRFANAIFEPLFSHQFVDHVQITASETTGMEHGRGAFYDSSGALRDMVQNHLLQLLCFVAIEPPGRLLAESVRNEKVKLLRSIEPLAAASGDLPAVRAQYTAGQVDGRRVPGYREEERVASDSRTPAYVALRLGIENWRWKGVPFYLRTGKCLPRRLTEVVVQFKTPPLQLFQSVECVGDVCDLTSAHPNRLIFRIQPAEGLALRISAKRPAMGYWVEDVEMGFSYSDKWPNKLPEAYERLLLDVWRGDSTLFTRSDEVEAAWEVVQPLLKAWESDTVTPLAAYAAGTWGPVEANRLFRSPSTAWHNPA